MKKTLILWGWWVLAWFGLSKGGVRANDEANRAVLKRETLWTQGGFIEKQSELEALRFGKSYTMAYGGCTLIAIYNTLVALELAPTEETFLELAADLQRRGAAWGGKYGIYPVAVRRWFQKHGIAAKRLRTTAESFAQNETEYKVFVVTVLNGARLRNWIHTVCITHGENGFVVHNGPNRVPFATLSEAVYHSSRQGATAIYAMGLGKTG